MLTAAVGPGEVVSAASLWDGSVDNKDSFVLTLDVQAGDFIEVNFSFTGAGSFKWTCTPNSTEFTTIGSATGYFQAAPGTSLFTTDHRMWIGLFISTATQTLGFKIIHQLVSTNSWHDYRIGNATLSTLVVGRNYD